MGEEVRILYILDISSYFYRAFHALPGLSTSQGFPTNAVFGVINMLLKVLREQHPQYLALAMDSKAPTFRHRLYSEYKAKRPPMPQELVKQIPYIHKVIQAFNLPTLEVEGFEADDLICTLVSQARERGFEVEIVSGDKDLLPLVQEGVTMWDPMREARYDVAAIREKFGVEPGELVEVRALAGDASDNIPGVPGIGEKTALKLISRYHSLESLLAHLSDLKEKNLRAKLEEYEEQARLSRRLTLLDGQVPLPREVEDLKPGTPDRETLRRLFLELEFGKFIKELGFEATSPEAFTLAKDAKGLGPVVQGILEAGQVSLFFLMGDQHPTMAPVAGLGLSWRPGAGVYLPLGQGIDAGLVWEKLGPLWSDPAIFKIGVDLKAALLAGRRFGQELAGDQGDLLLASYLVNPGRFEQTLENVALHYLGVNLPGPRELTGRPLAAVDLAPEIACQYAGTRAEAGLRLWPLLKGELAKEGLWPLYADLELPLVPVLARMETRGLPVDRVFLARFGRDLEGGMQRLEAEIYALAGEAFLIQSPQQLGRILFEKLKLTPQKKTKGKTAYSTDSEVLQSLSEQAPIAAKVLEYRSLGKLKATYVDALLKLINPATGRVHTTFLQSVAATGRLSSRDPNLQNIPVRGELGAQIRQAFVAPPGYVFLSADYSQMELRLLAHFSQDPILLKAFQEGVDIHRQTAAVVFGIHPELVTADMRRQAKVVNFGIIYGMSAFGLAKQLGVGNRLSQEFIQRYFARHLQVKAFIEETLAQARQGGWVTTLLGRRRQIPQINSSNRLLRQEAERAAINTPLQGSAADIIKKAMLRVEGALKEAGLGARMLLQIHDELLFELPEQEIEPTARLVRQVMEQAVPLQVPLVVDVRTGLNWGEMSPVEKNSAYS
ncbi:MAG: DNA polymerase I [Deltaproteobacteria bacterium RBG_13_58_19]|nr:MAG: DNA polymerase I [Deltaproteobacteria bacterium RBG_13_58_19]